MEPDRARTAEHRETDERGPAVRRDRVWVHVMWELLLAAAVAVAVLAVRREDSGALAGDSVRDLLVLVAIGILLGTSFALSLRAAVPNLAVGAAAVAAGVLVGWLVSTRGYDLLVAALVTLGTAAALGIGLAVLVVGFRAPAWAAGLGAALGLYAAVLSLTGNRSLLVPDAPDLRRWAWPLVGGAALVSVLGGALGLLPGVRAAVGRYRPSGDPAAGRGAAAGFAAALALVGSCVLAAGAGLLLSLRAGAVVPDDGLRLLAQAAAAALLGGASAHGRRGGILGTILAAAFLQLAALWLGLVGAEPWTRPALLGGALVVGLLVGRVVEAAGRDPQEPTEPDDEPDGAEPEPDPYSTESYLPYQTGPIAGSGHQPQHAGTPGYQPYRPYETGSFAAPDAWDEPRGGGARPEPGGGSPYRTP